MKVMKSDGKIVKFSPNKVRSSLRRTGAKKAMVDRIMMRVEPQIKDGMKTKQVYEIVHKESKKESSCVACRYNLRASLFRLGPAGFKFEKYVASILRAYDYDVEVPENDLHGVCVDHEIDVIATKDGRTVMIEAKFRNDSTHYVDLKDTMATWSRFLDLVDASKVGKTIHFEEVWIVTNARFSDRALQFGICKGMHMIGWNHPKEHSFAKMVDHNALYPLTVIDTIAKNELDSFASQDFMLCREVAEKDPAALARQVGLSIDRVSEIIESCKTVVELPD